MVIYAMQAMFSFKSSLIFSENHPSVFPENSCFPHVILSDFYPKSWIMLDPNLATFSSNVPSKETKMHCDLWMFSYDFAIRVFPWKPSQLPIFSLCFQLAKLSNYVIFVLYNVLWCVENKPITLVQFLKFGNHLLHACFYSKKITEKNSQFWNQRKTDRCPLCSMFS